MLATLNRFCPVRKCNAPDPALKPCIKQKPKIKLVSLLIIPTHLTFMVKDWFHDLTKPSARISFHVIKLWNSFPVVLFHVTNVALSVLIPIQVISLKAIPESEKTFCQICLSSKWSNSYFTNTFLSILDDLDHTLPQMIRFDLNPPRMWIDDSQFHSTLSKNLGLFIINKSLDSGGSDIQNQDEFLHGLSHGPKDASCALVPVD